MNLKFFIKAYLLIGFCSTTAFAQNQSIADSLIGRLSTISSLNDSSRYEIFYNIALNSTKPTEILEFAEKALMVAENASFSKEMGSAYLLIGKAYKLQGNLVLALEAFLKGAKIYEEANIPLGEATVYGYLGDLYSLQGNSNKALNYLKKSILIYQDQKDTLRFALAMLNTGDEYLKIDKLDSALFYLKESEFLCKSLNYTAGIAYSLGNQGLVYAKKERYSEAEEKLNLANEILEELGDNYPISVYNLSIADIYKHNGKYDQSLKFAYKSLEVARKINLKEQIRDASLKLSEIYAQTEDYQKAYEFHTQYVAYRDSINNEEVIRKMADLRTEYEVSQKQAEIDLLTKQRQINQLIGLALLFILLLLAVLAFLLYRNNRLKQSANKELSRQKKELEKQHQKLEVLNNTKDRFFSILSHDLRGPVNAFNGISELIKHYIAKNEMGQLREASEYMDKSARQLSTLLDNLLDWAIKQQGAFPFKAEKILLNPILEELVDMFRITAHGKNITMTLDVEEEIYIWADRNSLMTIVRNLLNNALKFTEKNGLVSLNAYTEKEFAHINIIDTGVGISEEKLEKLFNMQEKSLSRGTSNEKGLGIGLNLAYEFALMNGGTIMANSEVNAGTIFTLKVPVYRPGIEEKSLPAKQEDMEEV